MSRSLQQLLRSGNLFLRSGQGGAELLLTASLIYVRRVSEFVDFGGGKVHDGAGHGDDDEFEDNTNVNNRDSEYADGDAADEESWIMQKGR